MVMTAMDMRMLMAAHQGLAMSAALATVRLDECVAAVLGRVRRLRAGTMALRARIIMTTTLTAMLTGAAWASGRCWSRRAQEEAPCTALQRRRVHQRP